MWGRQGLNDGLCIRFVSGPQKQYECNYRILQYPKCSQDIKIAPTFGESNVITIVLAMNADGARIINSESVCYGRSGSVFSICHRFCAANL